MMNREDMNWRKYHEQIGYQTVHGILTDYLLADAWFGSKATIRLRQETSLIAVFRMKKNNMNYRSASTFTVKRLADDCMDAGGRVMQEQLPRAGSPSTL